MYTHCPIVGKGGRVETLRCSDQIGSTESLEGGREYRVDRTDCKSTGTTKYSPATIPRRPVPANRAPLYFPGKCRSTVTPRILCIISGKAMPRFAAPGRRLFEDRFDLENDRFI